MVIGAFVGARAALHGHGRSPLLLALVIMALVTAAACVLARSDSPWARPVVKK